MKYIEIKAPAKINFGLNIVSKRNDGYHNLETIFFPINNLFDVIKIEKSEQFLFTCDNQELENDKNNLILKAVKLLEFIQKVLPLIFILKKIYQSAPDLEAEVPMRLRF